MAGSSSSATSNATATDASVHPGAAGRLPALLAAGFILALTTWLWHRFNASPGESGSVFPFDLIFYYYPMLEQAAERLGEGQLPLWNPWQCCGVPFLATAQVAVFYPGTWLALFMSAGTAIVVAIFIHCVLGGCFAAMFFRSLGIGWYAAALGGGLFVFACMLGQSYWPPQVSTLCWMPFLFWAAEGCCRTGARRWWLALTAGSALQILAGFLQFQVYTWYLLGPFILVRLCHWRREHRETWPWTARRLSIMVSAALLAIGLSAVQWLPTLELIRETARNRTLSPEDVHYLDIERKTPLKSHGILHNVFRSSPKIITLDRPDGTGHLGVMTPFMLGLGLWAGRRCKHAWLFATAAALFFLLALGYSDGSRWLYECYARLPTGNMFRTPARLLVLCWFSVISLAVIGFDSLARGLPELKPGRRVGIMSTLLAVCLILLNAGLDGRRGLTLSVIAAGLVFLILLVGHHRWIRVSLLAVVAIFVAGTLAGATQASGSLRQLPVQCVSRLQYRGAAIVPTEALSNAARQAGLGRVALPFLWPAKLAQPAERHYAVCDYEPLLPRRWSRISREMNGTPVEITTLASPDEYPAFYDLAGVTHLFTFDMPEQIKADLRAAEWEFIASEPVPRQPGMTYSLRQRSTALPRAYLVGQYQIRNSQEVMQQVITGEFDWHGSVLLEEHPALPCPDAPAPAVPAEIVSYEPERVIVRTVTDAEQLLVLSDTWMPGWQARVNGGELPILRANYLFRAVRVPAGTSEVVFEYRPDGIRYGMIISGVSIMLVFGLIAASAFRPRAETHSAFRR